MLREKLKRFALKHNFILTVYRHSFGKLKTKTFFGMQRKALQRDGYDIIKNLDAALSAANAQYFVDCGTLLGMFRDGKLIAYDRDMDYGIWFDDHFGENELDRTMDSLGYKKKSATFFRSEVREITYVKGVLHVDFFVHEEIGTESRLYVFYRDPEKQYPDNSKYSVIIQKRTHITGRKRVLIQGIGMYIPENTEEYLASAYTENWRVPDPNWLYTMEPGCTYVTDEYGIEKHY